MTRYIYFFGNGKADGAGSMREILGGKGAGLAEMTNLGIPVPPGFTISTEASVYYDHHNQTFPPELAAEVAKNLEKLQTATGKVFGDPGKPLLVSVRSGARSSMPGMMDTILNLGLNDETAEGLTRSSGDRRFALDSYRRFIQMYSNVVLGLGHGRFDAILNEIRKQSGAQNDAEIGPDHLAKLIDSYKDLVKKETGKDFPQSIDEQLWGAIGAVFGSWNNQRAVTYRRLHGIPDDWGTAVNVQSMVFGNMGDSCATGVAFTRDPSTGVKAFYGEYLPNAQGEDVVAGIRTPLPISRAGSTKGERSLEEAMPEVYQDLLEIQGKLESHFRDMQDLEFTIEAGRLYLLQARNGKRTGFAAVRIAIDMVDEGLIDSTEAVRRVDPGSVTQLLAPVFDAAEKGEAIEQERLLAHGLPAGPGAACGRIALTAERAVEMSRRDPVILVREETSPEDIAGMNASAGILTSRGGLTSHAAVVARGMGRSCIVGAGDIKIDSQRDMVRVDEKPPLKEGDWISIDGTTGEVFRDRIATRPSEVIQVLVEKSIKPEDSQVFLDFNRLLGWADEIRTMGVRTNADTPEDARIARLFGAEGIGLCRTEHMFFEEERIIAMREMILARNEQGRRAALARLLPFQKADFEGIFRELEGQPVTIRLLDPPLHEFLPHTETQISSLARDMNWGFVELREQVNLLREANPMLGHRGCRLGITVPEIYEMQVRAIFEAACDVRATGIEVRPEVMIPLIGTTKELEITKQQAYRVARSIIDEKGVEVPVVIGTMIEIPRATLIAGEIAKIADFFSFGTNDLTQMTFGYSRDDVGTFLPAFIDKMIVARDPFESLDIDGVGQLVRLGTERGRNTNPDLKVGVCGEHGGDPDSIRFFHSCGFDYVSCSPYRVPVARLAAAQASLEAREKDA